MISAKPKLVINVPSLSQNY